MRDLTLRDVVAIVWRRRRSAGVCAAAVMLGTICAVVFVPRQYDAIAWLLAPPDYGRYSAQEAQWDAMFGLAGPTDLRTTAKLIECDPEIHAAALRSLGYEEPLPRMDGIARVWADVIEDTRIVEVRARMAAPDDAAELANALCVAYQEEDMALRQSLASDALAAAERAIRETGSAGAPPGSNNPGEDDWPTLDPSIEAVRRSATLEHIRLLTALEGRMRAMQASRAPQWRLVRRAVAPDEPSVPSIRVTLAVGILLTIVLPPVVSLLVESYQVGRPGADHTSAERAVDD